LLFCLFRFEFYIFSMSLQKIFILTIAVIILFGLMMLASSSSFQSQRTFGDPFHLFLNQIIQGVFLGGAGFFLAYVTPLRILKRFALPLFLLSVLLLVLLLVPHVGFEYGGARRWIQVGSLSFQPSEFAKIGLLFYVASWLASHKRELLHFSQGFLPILFMGGIIPFLILLEPNVSNFGITASLIFILLFAAGARIWHLLGFSLVILMVGFLSVLLLPSRLQRVETLLNPSLDPQGKSYQLNQSLIALGSGGVFGKGLGMSSQKYSALPEVSGDAIFAIIGEELGFVGSIVLILFYLAIFAEGMLISRIASDPFAQYFTIGFVSLIALQAFINVGAISGLLPLTGVTLPFISYGGSSLISLCAGSGLVAQAARGSNKR